MVANTCNPSYPGGRSRRIKVQSQPKQKGETLSEKETKAKSVGGVAQVVQHVTTKCKV
jgi:hypothetical protein